MQLGYHGFRNAQQILMGEPKVRAVTQVVPSIYSSCSKLWFKSWTQLRFMTNSSSQLNHFCKADLIMECGIIKVHRWSQLEKKDIFGTLRHLLFRLIDYIYTYVYVYVRIYVCMDITCMYVHTHTYVTVEYILVKWTLLLPSPWCLASELSIQSHRREKGFLYPGLFAKVDFT